MLTVFSVRCGQCCGGVLHVSPTVFGESSKYFEVQGCGDKVAIYGFKVGSIMLTGTQTNVVHSREAAKTASSTIFRVYSVFFLRQLIVFTCVCASECVWPLLSEAQRWQATPV